MPSTWIPEAIRFSQDAESGAVIEQLTSEPVTSTNIYCEQRYTSADGTRIAISRTPFGGPAELWVCNLTSLRLCRVAQGRALGANARCNAVYYLDADSTTCRLMRLDLQTLASTELACFADGMLPHGVTVSPDERYIVSGPFPVSDTVFSLKRTQIGGGTPRTLCEIEDMFNPHVQFDPSGSGQLVVQINRGGRLNLPGGARALTGRLGATLCTVDVESGQVRPLPVGRPHTPPISGHECWAGTTGRLLFTAGQYDVTASSFVTYASPPEEERAMPPAAIYSVAPGDAAARVVAQGLLFNHLAASDDGRFFVADDHATGRIYVGSIATGRYRGLCDSHTRQGACQHSHVHAYMTPDNRYVIFNSIVTGVAQVYAAQVPPGFLEAVLKA
jgi:hypothetical protein